MSRKFNVAEMDEAIVYIYGRIKQMYPSAFFTSMVHVMIHLPNKAKLTGWYILIGCIHLRGKLENRLNLLILIMKCFKMKIFTHFKDFRRWLTG